MASEKDNAPLSDTEGGEKPVREQLRKAHITSNPNAPQQDIHLADASSKYSNGHVAADNDEQRGRLHRKRSHEEIDAEDHAAPREPSKNHTRKRSRDSTVEEDQLNNGQRKVSGERTRSEDEAIDDYMGTEDLNGVAKLPRPATPESAGEKRGEAAVEALASPKTKRSRLHSTTAEPETALSDNPGVGSLAEASKIGEEAVSDEQSATESSKDDGSATKIPPTSGFANTSAISPFGSVAGSKSPTGGESTSSSAFAASGFSALATSSNSGFGAVGKQTGGFGTGRSFASGVKNSGGNDKPKSPPASAFGGALGSQSAFSSTSSGGFGSGASGFGKLGSSTGAFGSGLGGTGFGSLGSGALSSFSSGKPANALGSSSKSARPFGAPVDDDAEDADDDDKSRAKSPLATEEEKQDERFYEQELETGEEDEVTEFYARAKLYNFAPVEDGKKEWRERGLGVLRFNVKKAGAEQDSKPKARLLMRADGSHRVVLNTPVSKDIKFGAPTGGPPQSGYIYFMGTIDGKDGLELLQLKMKQANALDLHNNISTLQEEM